MTNAAPEAPKTVDPKGTAGNIVKGISDKAEGKSKEVAKEVPKETPKTETVDPNAGKRKYVVNGKDVFLTPEQADAYVQKGIAFEPKVSELARLQQETIKFLELLKTNPEQVLFNPKIGLTPEAVLEKVLSSGKISDTIKEKVGTWYYENVYKRAKMDDKERAILEKDERIKELESSEKAKADEVLARENKAKVDQALAQIRGQIGEAMKEIGLPNIDSTIGVQLAKRIADVMRIAHLTKKPVTPKEAAAKVRAEIKAYQTSFYDSLDEDKLVEELGKENAEKVRKHFLKIVKATEKESKQSDEKPSPRRGERKVMSPDEFRDYLDEMKRSSK